MKSLPRATLSLLFLTSSLLFGTQAAMAHRPTLPDNWSVRQLNDQGKGTLYKVEGLPRGSVMNVWAPPPLRVDDAEPEDAFLQLKDAYASEGFPSSAATRCKKITVSDEMVTQPCDIRIGKRTGHLEFVMLPVRGGKAKMLRVFFTGDPDALEPEQRGIGTVMSIEGQHWLRANSRQTQRVYRLSDPDPVLEWQENGAVDDTLGEPQIVR